MDLVEKVKEQANHAVGLAKQRVSQGQAKYDEMQSKRQAQGLFRRLGEAYYAQERHGGSAEAVSAALAAVDQHVAAQADKTGESDNGAATSGPVPAPGADTSPTSDD
jgi:hypothetical protein